VAERQGTGGADGEIRLLAGGDKLILRLSGNDWGSVYRQHRIGAGYASRRIARDDIVATRVGELHRDPRVIGIGRTGNVGAVEAPLVGEGRRAYRGDREPGIASRVDGE